MPAHQGIRTTRPGMTPPGRPLGTGPSAATRYGSAARAYHWATALLVALMVPVGFVLMDLPAGPIQDTAFDLHRSTGVLLFVLTALRLAHRLRHPPPPLPDDLPAAQRRAAGATHALLYALLLTMPIVGWWGTSAFGAPINVFWLFELPPLVAQDKAVAERVLGLHGVLGLLLVALVTLHVAGAAYHRLVRRDAVLARML